MNARLIGLLLALVLSLVPFGARAVDSPHDANDATNSACFYCHSLAVRTPGGATDYTQACLGCHNKPGHSYGSPWAASDEAVPGMTGNSHSWSGQAVSARYGSSPALSFANQALLVDGKLQCVLCHNAHGQTVGADPASMHTSIDNTVTKPTTEGTSPTGNLLGAEIGTAKLKLTAPAGSAAKGFRVRVMSVDGSGGTIILSHVYGFNSTSWVVWDGAAWVAGAATGAGRPYSNDADVDLDVAGIKVRISAGASVGDHWDFYVGYPFLRFSNVDDAICRVCHKEREMNHTRARGLDSSYLPNGIRKFSHPVGVTLNINGFNTDRTVILDADGTAGASATDGDVAGAPARNDSNNLTLGTGGNVRCTTCHAAHNTDSNSLTVDVR